MNKYIKVLFLLPALLFVVGKSNAQYYFYEEGSRFSMGVNIGGNMSSTGMNVTNKTVNVGGVEKTIDKFKTSSKLGITGSVNVDYMFPTVDLVLTSGLTYNNKKAKVEETSGEGELNAYFLSLPVQLLYSFDPSKDVNIKVGGGAYVAYGVGGQYRNKYNTPADHNLFRDKQGKAIMNRWDVGLGLSARGTFWDVLQVTVGYDFGLINMMKDPAEKIKMFSSPNEIVFLDKTKFSSLYFTVGVKIF